MWDMLRKAPFPSQEGWEGFLEEVPSQLKPESEVGGWEGFQAKGAAWM